MSVIKFVNVRVGHTHTNGSLIVGYYHFHFTTAGCSLLDLDLYAVSCGRPGFLRTYSSSSTAVENEKKNRRNDDTTVSEESKGTRENLNSYIQSKTTRKLSLIWLHLLEWMLPFLASVILMKMGIPVIIGFCDGDQEPPAEEGASSSEWFTYTSDFYLEDEESSGRGRSTSSVNQPIPGEQPPALPVMQEAANQDLPNVPYPHDEIIGRDSIERIQLRLLWQSPNPSAQDIYLARIQAEDQFEVKVDIIRRMAVLDPEGDWLGRGARALDNPRTTTGEDSLETLYRLRADLEERGIRSQSFWDLKGKVFLRQQNIDAESQA